MAFLGYDGPKVQKYSLSHFQANASFRDVARSTPTTVKTSKNWRFPNHKSPQQFNNRIQIHCVVSDHRKDPDSYPNRVLYHHNP